MVHRKHQKSVSPSTQLHRQHLSNVITLEIWNLLKPFNFHGKPPVVNCGYFQSISAVSSEDPTLSHPQPLGRWLCIYPWNSLHTGATVVSMNTLQQISGTCVLTTECCFWPQRHRPWNKPPLLPSCPLLQSPSPWSEEISREFKEMACFIFLHFFFLFPFVEARHWGMGHSKVTT